MLPAFLTTVLFSISALFAQRTARVLGGIRANFWRMLLATLLLALLSRLFAYGGVPPETRLWLFVSGLLGFGLGDVALFQALPRLGSRLSILLVHCLATPFAAVVEYLWLGSTLSLLQILCIAMSLSGVAVALAPARGTQSRHAQFALGIVWGLLAMLGQSMGAVLSRKAASIAQAAHHPLNGIDAASARSWGGILVSSIVFAVFLLREGRDASGGSAEKREPLSGEAKRQAYGWVLCNTLAGPVLGVSCYQWALGNAPTGLVLPIVALTPLVIMPMAHWMEGERTTRREIIGGIIAVAGVVLLTHFTVR